MSEFYMDNQIGGIKLELNKIFLKDCECIKAGEWKVYYTPHKSGSEGFEAVAITFGSCPGDSTPFDLDTEINDRVDITAHFDGVRHIHFNHGTKDVGYLYYPSNLIKLFEVLNTLTKKYCNQVDDSDLL